jgi:hypothetical protein
MRTRTHYLPIEAASEGMVLADGVRDPFQRTLLAAGVLLTQENIQQLVAHQAEFICISEEEVRTDEQIASDAAEAADRVLAVFEHADLSNPVLAALFNQVSVYRSA